MNQFLKKAVGLCIGTFTCCLTICAQSVSFNGENLTVSQAFTAIEAQTGYRFAYNSAELDTSKEIYLDYKNADALKVVNDILKGSGYKGSLDGNYIIISPASEQDEEKQQTTVTGTVTDVQGQPVIGAGVIQKGTSNGVMTDEQGHFSIELPDNSVLEISSLGYRTVTLSVVRGG